MQILYNSQKFVFLTGFNAEKWWLQCHFGPFYSQREIAEDGCVGLRALHGGFNSYRAPCTRGEDPELCWTDMGSSDTARYSMMAYSWVHLVLLRRIHFHSWFCSVNQLAWSSCFWCVLFIAWCAFVSLSFVCGFSSCSISGAYVALFSTLWADKHNGVLGHMLCNWIFDGNDVVMMVCLFPLMLCSCYLLYLSTVQVMSIKAVGIAIKLTMEGINQAGYFQTWVFVMVAISCIIIQLNYLNKVSDLSKLELQCSSIGVLWCCLFLDIPERCYNFTILQYSQLDAYLFF